MTPMKLFVTSIAILVMLCNAESDPGSRTLHRKHGGKNGGKHGSKHESKNGSKHGGKGNYLDRIQSIIDEECGVEVEEEDAYDCSDDNNTTLAEYCIFKRVEHPDMSGLDPDEKADCWDKVKEDRREKIAKCACCAGMSGEDIHASKKQAMLDEKCPTFKAENCPDVLSADIDCTRYDSANTSTRALGRRGKNFLFCGCCERIED